MIQIEWDNNILENIIPSKFVATLAAGSSAHLGNHDRSLATVGLVECNHFFEGVFADDITVENEERFARSIVKLIPG
jgi:hypothetical protein